MSNTEDFNHPGKPHLIYLVDDDTGQTALLSRALQDDGYQVQIFSHPAEFRAVCAAGDSERPAAVIMNMIFPEGDDAGAKVLVELKAQHTRCPPVIFISARDDLPSRLAAFRAGASRYLVKPVVPARLVDLLDELTDRQPAQPYRVLLVDDDPLLLEAQAGMLRAAGMEVVALAQPLLILDILKDFSPDVAVLDIDMPDASGPELAAVLHEREEQVHLPILFLSTATDISRQLLALNLGGDDFLVKPVQAEHLVAAVTSRARRIRRNIAVQQRLEATLYEREREHLAVNQHAIVSIADRAGNITYVNDKFCEISAYSRAELLGNNHRLLKSDEHPPAYYQALWQTIAGGKVWQGEMCNRRKDGSLYWVESTITPFLDSSGQPYQYVSIRTDISHMKEAENAARVSAERLRRGQLYANIGTWDWNIQTGELYWTERIAPLFGYPVSELETSYDNFLAAIHPDDRQAVIDAVSACVERDVPYEIEHRVVWPDGTVRWLLERGAVLRDAAGKPLQMLGVVQDIDDRKRAEQALAERERELREAQRLARLGSWTVDLASGKQTWSDEIYNIFGRDRTTYAPDIPGYYRDIIHPDDAEKVRLTEQATIASHKLQQIDHRFIHTDGSVRWVHLEGRAVRDSSGNVIQLSGTVQDINDRKRAEIALEERERQLREAQTMAHLGNWSANIVTGELAWSDEIYLIFGHVPGSFAPSVGAFKAAVHPDDRELVRESEALSKKSGRHNVVHRIVRPDGTVRHVHEMAKAETDSSGNLLRLTGTVQDITEQVEIELALIAARDEAERANQAKSEFLSSMSHELRTPMNAILGFGQLLQYDQTLTPEQQDSVGEIMKAGEHLLELINEVLDLAKVESGHIVLSIEPVELCPIVEECLALIGIMAEKRHIKISHKGLQGVALRADRIRLKQALLNLLSNAVKYNREGGSVHLEVTMHGADRLRILVQDSGRGIASDRLQDIFQPFNRLEAEGSSIEGTGIGLTITRRIVEMMGGSIGVASETGAGSTFWIEFPLEAMPAVAQQQGADRLPKLAHHRETAPHTVLYIEDNPSNLRLMAQILGRRKHIHLLTAHTPDLGIELALARCPALILLDINMPGMDGYQVLQVLKAEAGLKHIPVVAVTANAMQRDIERGLAAGFSHYLTKPIDIALLFGILDRNLPG